MRAVVYHGPGRLSVETLPDPRPGPGELVVRVSVALTCGTDLKAFLRGHRLFRPPMPFGHEMTGVVEEVGDGVTRFKVGDRVVSVNSAPCRVCFFCKRGQTSLCEQLDAHLNWGAYAELVRVPAPIVAQNTHPVPPHLSDVAAAALEPLACVVAGVDAASPAAGESVVVLGATGAIGLMMIQVLRHAGASPLIAVGRSPDRLRLALELGADLALPSDATLVETVRAATDGRGADAVIEATGQTSIWELAPDLCRRGGRVIMFGGCPGGSRFSLDTGRVHYDALTIRGVFHHTPATVERALELLSAGRVRVEPFVDADGRLEDVEPLLRRMAEREIVKAAIRP